MRPWLQALALLLLAPRAFARAPRKRVVVVTAGWTATSGELYRFERAGRRWRQVGAAVPVVVGAAGLAWPRDKREGDERAPAGRFRLGGVTGYDDAPPPGTTLPYRKATPDLLCIDDPRDPDYNRVTEPDWVESGGPDGRRIWEPQPEHMLRPDELYRLTIFVRHNDARVPGRGSCIFLHVWRAARSPTVGCTAMALPDLRALVAWADRDTELVELPRAEYRRLQRAWDLPPLDGAQRK